ncbi:MAG TPA: DUF305 domain-containing protein [Gemmatimonadaceae bacterium]|nr:DUF305 domain-containing protein [Gemmatimonadaceae bacterium]
MMRPRFPTPLSVLVMAGTLTTVAPACAQTAGSSAARPATASAPAKDYVPADVQFMQGMIHHHQQAVVMAAMAPTHGASERIQLLAKKIDLSQRDEMAFMQRWLEDRGLPVPEVGAHDHVMMHMPGMLTPEQMQQLDQARGAEFDRLFLAGMIQHHQGALTMVKELFAAPGGGQEPTLFDFAAGVDADQRAEIERMQQMLNALPTPRSPAP